jgi:hypothetical protein
MGCPNESQGRKPNHFYENANPAWHETAERIATVDDIDPYSDVIKLSARIAQMMGGRQAFVSRDGYCGLVPSHSRVGDLLCILLGCDVPVVLRPVDNLYIFVGECYIHRLMQREAIEALEVGVITSQNFEIH